MNSYPVVLLIFLFFSLSSCDPSHRLMVSNQSQAARQIKVHGICKDAVVILSSPSDSAANKKQNAVQTSMCVDQSFGFELQPGQTAVIENELGPIPYAKLIVIDGRDTVKVPKSKGRITKKPRFWIGGDYTLTINH
ncbi:MAG TPA: hypothetical protein VGB71_02780 [Flavisolibacter sp.]|jgi:hypothetical protein